MDLLLPEYDPYLGRNVPTSGHPGSLDDLVRASEQRLRDGEAKHLGGFEIDNQLQIPGLLDREVSRLGTPENLSGLRA